MHRSLIPALLLIGVLFGGSITPAGAQEMAAVVVGGGEHTLRRKPTFLQMDIVLTARGKTLKVALDALAERKQAASLLLATLKADKDSITFGDSEISAEEEQQRMMFQQLIAQRVAQGASVPKGLKPPTTRKVSCTLSVRWPLEYDSPEQLLVQADAVREQVVTADLAGKKEKKELSPQEEELQEELAQLQSQYGYGGQQTSPDEPKFVYVAIITVDERKKAMADAFVKARDKATQLAAAAGVKLGTLVELSGEGSGISFDPTEELGYSPYYAYQMAMAGQTPSTKKDNEASSLKAGEISFQFHVQAKFRLSQ